MSDSALPRETEVKFEVRDRQDLESRLRALGAVSGPREFESNILLDDESSSVIAAGNILRIRETDGRGLVTLKGKRSIKDGVKTRIEIETGVDSASSLQAIFEMLGFRPGFRYEKYRTVWTFVAAVRPIVVLDETPMGLYAEIEGEESAIRALADELGVPASSFVEESYPALWTLARRIVPSRPRDMVFS